MTEYYHDSKNRTVYAVPSQPKVTQKPWGWRIEITWQVIKEGEKLPRQVSCHESYDNATDTEEKAVRWFTLQHQYPPCEKIDEKEYRKLTALYGTPVRLTKQVSPA